ncbi:MAG: putative toxin-antitoxin system toxin component, PIN family [Pirellulales bacterium]|nr:putative toxin-antitoxin system toxin component, PIN family [Pirellulales bacterium]
MRVLLDTNILARAAAGPPGLANELVLAAARHEHVLLLSPFLVSELSRVLRYDRVRAIHKMDDDAINQYVADLIAVAEIVMPSADAEQVEVVVGDPDDDPVVAAAVVGKADALCTKDRHLKQSGVVSFCASHGIEVISDVELLNRLR